VLFYGFLAAPPMPSNEAVPAAAAVVDEPVPSTSASAVSARPGSMVRVPEPSRSSHSRNSSWDLRLGRTGSSATGPNPPAPMLHSRNPSMDFMRHSRNSSADLNKVFRNEVGLVFSPTQNSHWVDPMRVQIIKAHQNWIAVAYAHFVTCYRVKDSNGWQQVFTSPHIDATKLYGEFLFKVLVWPNFKFPAKLNKPLLQKR